MRYLLLISVTGWLLACSGPYKAMQKSNIDLSCVQSFKPAFTTALYNTKVNVIGKHLSGLLVIKTMPDSSIRIVFSNEAGFKFFDFGFSGNDFKLVLMNNLDVVGGYLLKNDQYNYYTFVTGKDHYYYITDRGCQKLVRMERGSSRKPVMTAIAENFNQGMPDTIGITHSNFNFDIGLKRIYNYAER